MTVRQQSYSADNPLTSFILYLVHSNVFISLAAASIAVSTILLADLSLEVIPLFIVFSVTLFVYSFNRLTDLAEDVENVPGRAAFVYRHGRFFLAVGAILYALATAIAILEGIPGAPAMSIPLVVAFLYSVVGLKRVLLVKNLLVGLSWGLIPLGVGVYYGILWTLDILFMFGFVTAMLTIAAAVFDIKDVPGDRAEGIRTVPIVLGIPRTRQLAAVATLLVSVLVVTLVVMGVLTQVYLLLLLFTAYVFGYSLVARADRTPLFYGFVIDGEHIVLALVLLSYEYLLPVIV